MSPEDRLTSLGAWEMLIELVNSEEKERGAERERKSNCEDCSLNLGCLLNYSCNFFFRFVILQNTKLEGKEWKICCFPFCTESTSFRGDWNGLCRLLCLSPFLAWPPRTALAAHKYCWCPKDAAALSACLSLYLTWLCLPGLQPVVRRKTDLFLL